MEFFEPLFTHQKLAAWTRPGDLQIIERSWLTTWTIRACDEDFKILAIYTRVKKSYGQ